MMWQAQDFQRLRRWEETDDLLQNAMVRLCRALDEVRPATLQRFFRLAAVNLRRELTDLARRHFGPEGSAAHRAPDLEHARAGQEPFAQVHEPSSAEPDRLASWSEFHEHIAALPDEEREMFDLLWYQGLKQEEAAILLGLSERTVKRRWQAARLKLFESVRGEPPF